jgi:hypothetical protein
MSDSTPLPVSSPTPPPPSISPPVKKTQEDVNIEVYEAVFLKCMGAAARIILHRQGDSIDNTVRVNQVTIASAIFDRFYNDQTAMKAGAIQAKAMIDGMTQVLEGRR